LAITQIDSVEFETSLCQANSLINIDGTDYYISAYKGVDNDGFLTSFSVDSSYEITEIDTLEHDTTEGSTTSLCYLTGLNFILGYGTTDNVGHVKLFSIDSGAEITQLYDLTLTTGTNSFIYPSIVKINNDHIIILYENYYTNKVVCTTLSISGANVVSTIKSIDVDTGNNVGGSTASMVQIDSTHYFVAYTGDGGDGYVGVLTIDGSYDISVTSTLEHDTDIGIWNSVVKIDSTHFMLAYSGSGTDGFIKTFSIDGSYNITEIDSLEHDTSDCNYNALTKLDSTHYGLVYRGVDADGFIKTFSINGSYEITQIDSLEHDTTLGSYNSAITIDSNHVLASYSGADSDGFIKTFAMGISSGWSHKINGISPAKVNGIAVADIEKINGV